MIDYYTSPLKGDIKEAPSPSTPLEKHTRAVYTGPPQVVGGAGRPISHYPQSQTPVEEAILPSYPSQQMVPEIPFTPNTENQTTEKEKESRVVPIAALDENAGVVKCPKCNQANPTNTRRVIGASNHMWAGVAFFFGICCIPYMMNRLKNVEHRCSNCDVHLATWYRASGTKRVNLKK
ncbi:hypothetical protein CPB86DRAFT_872154 [Serendipita vermifera]|nr:hypothetical protein CPB86DRAFT_872154 [Serendipita vermifera]